MDVTDEAERELERMVRTRHDPLDGAEMSEPLWAESVRAYHARAAAERREQWKIFHESMCDLHRRLSEEHAAKAAELEGSP